MVKHTKILLIVLISVFIGRLTPSYASRRPLLDCDLVDRSDIVLIGTVKYIIAEHTEEPAKAQVEIIEVLKGTTTEGTLTIPFMKSEGRESVSPVQLHEGKRYILFLARRNKRYELVNPYDAVRSLNAKEEKKARELVTRDRELDKAFKDVSIELNIQSPIIKMGQSPVLTFTVSNRGKTGLCIEGEVLDKNGRLCIRGWMNLIFEELKDGKVVRQVCLGGAHSWRTPDLLIPAGETLKWKSEFEWRDYGRSPGTYQIRWKFGKKVSVPVVYEVVPHQNEAT